MQTRFDDALRQWKDAAKRAILFRQAYFICEADEAPQLFQEWVDAIKVGTQQFERMIELSLERIEVERSRVDPPLITFLVEALEGFYEVGRYDRAREITGRLVASYGEIPSVLARHAASLYALNEFEECRKVLARIEASAGGLSPELASVAASIEAQAVKWQRERALREAEAARDDLPRVRLICDLEGEEVEVVLELFEDQAPNTVANFIHLVREGFYTNLEFFQVVSHGDARTGSPDGTASGGPGYRIAGEHGQAEARAHFRGSLSLCSEQGTGGSQFAICYTPLPQLDGAATVFGRVLSGMDVVNRFTRTHEVEGAGRLKTIDGAIPTRIVRAEVVRDRGHAYTPQKVGPQ